jgi:hypothetical protein
VEVKRARGGARTPLSGLATSVSAIRQSGKCLARGTHKPFGSLILAADHRNRSLIRELLVPATDADKDATAGSTDRHDEARRRISAACLDYARYYVRARDGMLAGEPDPEVW